MFTEYGSVQDFANLDTVKEETIDRLCLESARKVANYSMTRSLDVKSFKEIVTVNKGQALLTKANPTRINYITDLQNMNSIEEGYEIDSENKKLIFKDKKLEKHTLLICYFSGIKEVNIPQVSTENLTKIYLQKRDIFFNEKSKPRYCYTESMSVRNNEMPKIILQ